MNEQSKLLSSKGNGAIATVEGSKWAMTVHMVLSFALGVGIAMLAVVLKSHHGSIAASPDPSSYAGARTIQGVAPLPSEQDWCMAPGSYELIGTYRSSGDVALENMAFAPGRFQGKILTAQTDEAVYFNMVNLTYGNLLSENHIPNNEEEGLLDIYCTLKSDNLYGPSSCYGPKHYPRGKYAHTRCGRVEFPSIPGFALCRALPMANFDFVKTQNMGGNMDIQVEQWRSRLSTEDIDAPNDYDGELSLFMQNVPGQPHLKIPLTHWLTSDDQTLETSFQVMNRQEWDPSKFPEVPEGCEEFVDIEDDPDRPDAWTLFPSQHRKLSTTGNVGCPFGHLHRGLVLPAWHHHVQQKEGSD